MVYVFQFEGRDFTPKLPSGVSDFSGLSGICGFKGVINANGVTEFRLDYPGTFTFTFLLLLIEALSRP
jgi:hypothetical protein